MLIILFAIQACLWLRADQLVQSSAADGQQAAADVGGSPATGVAAAEQDLATNTAVSDAHVSSEVSAGDFVEIDVSATAESIVPWLHLQVSATRRGPIQEFRSAG
jgi:hypothetical protein